MRDAKIETMQRPVTELLRERDARLRRAQASPRRPRPTDTQQPFRGRAWINGREVGGTQPRFAHLTVSYD